MASSDNNWLWILAAGVAGYFVYTKYFQASGASTAIPTATTGPVSSAVTSAATGPVSASIVTPLPAPIVPTDDSSAPVDQTSASAPVQSALPSSGVQPGGAPWAAWRRVRMPARAVRRNNYEPAS